MLCSMCFKKRAAAAAASSTGARPWPEVKVVPADLVQEVQAALKQVAQPQSAYGTTANTGATTRNIVPRMSVIDLFPPCPEARRLAATMAGGVAVDHESVRQLMTRCGLPRTVCVQALADARGDLEVAQTTVWALVGWD